MKDSLSFLWLFKNGFEYKPKPSAIELLKNFGTKKSKYKNKLKK